MYYLCKFCEGKISDYLVIGFVLKFLLSLDVNVDVEVNVDFF